MCFVISILRLQIYNYCLQKEKALFLIEQSLLHVIGFGQICEIRGD